MERSSFSPRTVLLTFALTLVAGMAIAIYVFENYATYESTALRHVPVDAEQVIRVNLEQGVLYDPMVKYLLPLFERGRSGPEPRIKHLERKTTLELGTDARELVFAQLDGERWLLVVAGLLRKDGVVDGVARLLDDEHAAYSRRKDALIHESGVAFGVAPSGTLLLASDFGTLESALRRDEEAPWAGAMHARGVALAIRIRASEEAAMAAAASPIASGPIVSGSAAVVAESHFPVKGRFSLAPGHWTADQVSRAFAQSEALLAAVLPLRVLRATRINGGEVAAEGNLGRERFNDVVERLAKRLDQALPSVAQPRK